MRLLAIALAAGIAVAPQQDPERARFSSAAHGVSIDVAVFDGKNVVTSLTAADFQVIDNGVEQKVESVDLNRLPIDLKLVFDTSGSISPEGTSRYFKQHHASPIDVTGTKSRGLAATAV